MSKSLPRAPPISSTLCSPSSTTASFSGVSPLRKSTTAASLTSTIWSAFASNCPTSFTPATPTSPSSSVRERSALFASITSTAFAILSNISAAPTPSFVATRLIEKKTTASIPSSKKSPAVTKLFPSNGQFRALPATTSSTPSISSPLPAPAISSLKSSTPNSLATPTPSNLSGASANSWSSTSSFALRFAPSPIVSPPWPLPLPAPVPSAAILSPKPSKNSPPLFPSPAPTSAPTLPPPSPPPTAASSSILSASPPAPPPPSPATPSTRSTPASSPRPFPLSHPPHTRPVSNFSSAGNFSPAPSWPKASRTPPS